MSGKISKFFLYTLGLFFSLAFAVQAQPLNLLFHHAGDPVAGNPKGKVTIVEFFDYQCSHCMKMAPAIESIISTNPDVRVVFKDFPIRGPMSDYAARAALAANLQGKYYPFNHALLLSSYELSESNIDDIAKSVGLDVNQLHKDMKGKKVTAELNSTLSLARKINLSGTPAFYIGKTDAKDINSVKFVLGEMSESELQDAIDKAGA